MCKWGNYETLFLTIVKELSYTGKERMKMVKVDKCIAPIIKALNQGGIITTYSCCRHGEDDGIIVLKDGRCLTLKENTLDVWGFKNNLS